MVSMSLAMGPPSHGTFLTILKCQFYDKVLRAPPGTSLSGKVAIITGAGSGLGLEASRHFLSLKLSHLVMSVRNLDQGNKVAAQLRSDFPSAHIDVWHLEMTSYSSVQSFARRVESDLDRLDIVILNSGMSPIGGHILVPETGHERSVQINYLSTILLAILLLPALKTKSPKGQPGRLTIIGSQAADFFGQMSNHSKVPFLPSCDEIKFTNPMERYGDSKMLLQLSFIRLVDYVDPDEIIINMCDPGITRGPGLGREAVGIVKYLSKIWTWFSGRTQVDAAWAYVDAAVVREKETHGSFVMTWNISSFARFAYTPEGAELIPRLWDETIAELDFASVRDILGLRK